MTASEREMRPSRMQRPKKSGGRMVMMKARHAGWMHAMRIRKAMLLLDMSETQSYLHGHTKAVSWDGEDTDNDARVTRKTYRDASEEGDTMRAMSVTGTT
jgi:hypothetical protein